MENIGIVSAAWVLGINICAILVVVAGAETIIDLCRAVYYLVRYPHIDTDILSALSDSAWWTFPKLEQYDARRFSYDLHVHVSRLKEAGLIETEGGSPIGRVARRGMRFRITPKGQWKLQNFTKQHAHAYRRAR